MPNTKNSLAKDIVDDCQATKKQIIETATELFSQFGYVGVAMSKIADSLGITKAALYYHFDSKSSLYLETLNQASEEFIVSLEEVVRSEHLSYRQKMQKVITLYLEIGLRKGSLIQLTIQKIKKDDCVIINSIVKARKQIIYLIEPVIKEFLEAGGKIKKVNSLLMTKLLIGMLDSYLLRSLFRKDNQWTPKEIARQIDVALFN